MLILMITHLKGRKAQSTLEYAALIAVVAGALVAINLYMKRGVQGQLRSASDDIGTQYDLKDGSYHQVTEMKTGEEEKTHSVFGRDTEYTNDITPPSNLDWIDSEVNVKSGTEMQWTQTPAERSHKEITKTTAGADVKDVGSQK